MGDVLKTTPLFGVAYYDEYMPHDIDRIETDMKMMRDAGINVIRIAESTWSTLEPQPGVFDFTHVDRAIDAAQQYDIQVIVGTPSYAVPSWLVQTHSQVLADTANGKPRYGARQLVDIVDPAYLFHVERVIRVLVAHVASRNNVIGYQVDNETKHYDSVSIAMQRLFVKHLRQRFNDDLNKMNAAFGLDYWSNRIDGWEDFPDVTGTINASLKGAFEAFRREQVSAFLAWEARIVREHARPDQFVTHNFDLSWRGYSYGLQPAVNHFRAAEPLDIVGVDIYHPSENRLTGKEIAFGGDVMRGTKNGANYLVLETQAQGQNGWLPYPGQLRMQAFSHFAAGASGLMYWHWHSIHHSFETYWKGLLGHDMEANPTYREAQVIGSELRRPEIYSRVLNLRKVNNVAVMVSNEALMALDWFRLQSGFPDGQGPSYNDILRKVYDSLFDLNVEVDFLPPDATLEQCKAYSLIIVPVMYCAPDSTITTLRDYLESGGHVLATMRSFVADSDCGVWHDRAPHRLTDLFGVSYNQFSRPEQVGLVFQQEFNMQEKETNGNAEVLIELLHPAKGTEVLAQYDHPVWGSYPAITRHRLERGGWAEWMGTIPDRHTLDLVLKEAVQEAVGLSGILALAGKIVVRQGVNKQGEKVTFLFNYSQNACRFESPVEGTVVIPPVVFGTDGTISVSETNALQDMEGLAVDMHVLPGQTLSLNPWSFTVLVM